MARFAPFGDATSPDHSTSGMDSTYSAICSASAIAGTARGETNAVASIRCTPVATSACSSRIFSSVRIGVLDLQAVARADFADVDVAGQGGGQAHRRAFRSWSLPSP